MCLPLAPAYARCHPIGWCASEMGELVPCWVACRRFTEENKVVREFYWSAVQLLLLPLPLVGSVLFSRHWHTRSKIIAPKYFVYRKIDTLSVGKSRICISSFCLLINFQTEIQKKNDLHVMWAKCDGLSGSHAKLIWLMSVLLLASQTTITFWKWRKVS